jgi:diguanylate cyclase (GGDEF)-like protein
VESHPNIDLLGDLLEPDAEPGDTSKTPAADPLFRSYADLARAMVEEITGICLLDAALAPRGASEGVDAAELAAWLRTLGWLKKSGRQPVSRPVAGGELLTAIPLARTDGRFLGAFCARVRAGGARSTSASAVAARLKPVLDSLHRELDIPGPGSRVRTLTQRTEELEWLFEITQRVSGGADERRVVAELLAAATERLDSTLGALLVTERRLALEHVRDEAHATAMREALGETREHLLNWALRQRRPLVLNHAGAKTRRFAPCKILAVPIALSNGKVIGVLAFFRRHDAADFSGRQVFLARHLGRQTATLVEVQFDLMTGLYTRSGLSQAYGSIPHPEREPRSVVYLDVDHMHAVNELHGFELGNELMARMADVLTSSVVPAGTLAARVSGDRFALIVPGMGGREAADLARQVQAAARRIVLGPAENPIDVSLSGGTADLVDMPEGLARALAAAEIACRLAKDRGRNRIEVYASEDSSLIRRRDDVAAVSLLRNALRSDSLVLYAQRIAPLRNRDLAGGYEILMRLRNPDGSLTSPGPLMEAAQRYQLLPSVDRWVVQNALRLMSAYRGMLASSEVSMSINLTGQSLSDEACVDLLVQALERANLPRGSVVVELTEQAALRNLARANHMMQRLAFAGCKFALDDFGTGTNSLVNLKNLPISHVKIDGSFVRDILVNPRSQATVRGVVELARGFGIATVAEYVENPAIADRVRELGVDFAQGYAFGKPEPLEGLLQSLSADESRRMHRVFLEL